MGIGKLWVSLRRPFFEMVHFRHFEIDFYQT